MFAETKQIPSVFFVKSQTLNGSFTENTSIASVQNEYRNLSGKMITNNSLFGIKNVSTNLSGKYETTDNEGVVFYHKLAIGWLKSGVNSSV
ncbi:hypothetical protein [Collibacillus ludicampi]|uniref:hypothetical protein n=1 Tax=Collibacillus ludicampi TaxID=2771369 RepID=UPI0024958D94|nr:hypothetical protein [Collibacillus ludicampi]